MVSISRWKTSCLPILSSEFCDFPRPRATFRRKRLLVRAVNTCVGYQRRHLTELSVSECFALQPPMQLCGGRKSGCAAAQQDVQRALASLSFFGDSRRTEDGIIIKTNYDMNTTTQFPTHCVHAHFITFNKKSHFFRKNELFA